MSSQISDDGSVKVGEGAPRHLGGGAELSPEYRVSFWTSPHAEEWEVLTEADADEVLAWAAANANGRPYSVYARSISLGLDGRLQADEIRLYGIDPPHSDEDFPPWAARPSWAAEPTKPLRRGRRDGTAISRPR